MDWDKLALFLELANKVPLRPQESGQKDQTSYWKLGRRLNYNAEYSKWMEARAEFLPRIHEMVVQASQHLKEAGEKGPAEHFKVGMFVEPICKENKSAMITLLRQNRSSHDMWRCLHNSDVISKVTHMWWNPSNSTFNKKVQH